MTDAIERALSTIREYQAARRGFEAASIEASSDGHFRGYTRTLAVAQARLDTALAALATVDVREGTRTGV